MIPSYPKIWAFGGKIPINPFDGRPAVFQEKVDGSQFSFGLVDGHLHMRSKSQEQSVEQHDNMFALAVDRVTEFHAHGRLPAETVFRCEYLNKPKHNTLVYGRVPDHNLVAFDVFRASGAGLWDYLPPTEARPAAEEVGLEFVPTWTQVVTKADEILAMLDRESFLGSTPVEGVVMKRYDLLVPQFSAPLFCKYVSERFKEVHGKDWKDRNPTGKDFAEDLVEKYRTEARWEKAVQHLSERGELLGEPKDIGALIAEVRRDIDEECREEIADALYRHWSGSSGRSLVRGLPEWYKERLLSEAVDAA